MARKANLEKVLGVLKKRLDQQGAVLSDATATMAKMDQMRSDLISEVRDVADFTSSLAVTDPTLFRYRQLRARKLTQNLQALLPERAKAARTKLEAKRDLQNLLRQRMCVEEALRKESAKQAKPSSEFPLSAISAARSEY